MPAELFQRLNLDRLYLPFLNVLLCAIADCKTVGRNYTATLGFRTYAESDKLYTLGRTVASHVPCLCDDRRHPLGHTVSNAQGGESAHNFGLAVDFYAGDWDAASYDLLGQMVAGRGLVWGGSWKHPDRPHVQWPGFVTAASLAPLDAAFRAAPGTVDEKLARVWDSI